MRSTLTTPARVRSGSEEPPGGSVIQQCDQPLDPGYGPAGVRRADSADVEYHLGQRLRGGHPRRGDPQGPQIRNGSGVWKASPWWFPSPVEAKVGADGKTTEFVFVERLGRFGWKCQEAPSSISVPALTSQRWGSRTPCSPMRASLMAGMCQNSTPFPIPKIRLSTRMIRPRRCTYSASTSNRSRDSCGRPNRLPGTPMLLLTRT